MSASILRADRGPNRTPLHDLLAIALGSGDLDGAACKGLPGDYWYPEGSGREVEERAAYAKRICNGCPVREKCLIEALHRGEVDGIYGGVLLIGGLDVPRAAVVAA